MIYTKAYITTEDQDFSEELCNANIDGVTVLTRLTAAVQWDQIIQHTIEFASDASIALFAFWLKEKMVKKKPRKTRINGRKMPSDKDKLIRIIKNIEPEIETEEEEPD